VRCAHPARRAGATVALAVGFVLSFGGVADASLGLPSFGAAKLIDAQPPYVQTSSITGISCGLPSTCVAVSASGVQRATDAGGATPPTWSRPLTIPSTPPVNLSAVSCTATSLCVAISPAAVVHSSDGGATWSAPLTINLDSGQTPLTGVSCTGDGATGEVCVVVTGTQVGGRFAVSRDGGVTWSALASLGPALATAVSCIPGACVAAARTGTVAISKNVTATTPTWTTTTPGLGGVDLHGISCMASGVCVAVDQGGNALISTDVRSATAPTWTVVDVDPTSSTGMRSVSCSDAGLCVVGDDDGNVFVSSDVSAVTPMWSKTSTGDAASLTAMACGTAGWCVAGDGFGNAVYSADVVHPVSAPWSAPVSLNGINSMRGVSCTAGGLCGAIDNIGHAVTSVDGGGTWSAPVLAEGRAGLQDISCVDAGGGTCVVIDNVRNAIAATQITQAQGPPTWVRTTAIAPSGLTNGVSCAESGLCVVVTSAGKAVFSTDVGASWSAAMATTDLNRLNAVSCPTGTLCVAVDTSGQALISHNPSTATPTWTAPALIDADETGTGRSLVDLSCTAAGTCVAVDTKGFVVVSSDIFSAGPTWSAPVQIAGGFGHVSCTGSLCVATDGAVTRASTDPSVAASWSVVATGSSLLADVSCVKSGRCVGVDSVGDALVGVSPIGKVALSGVSESFGDTVVDSASAVRTVTVTNSGGAPLISGAMTLTGDDADQFTLSNDTCDGAVLAPGGQCSVDVAFAPTILGSDSASLALSSDATTSPDSVALSGTGVSAPVTPPPPPPPGLDVTPPPGGGGAPQGQKPAAPSNVVRFSKVTAGVRGAITVVLKIPGAGRLTVTSTCRVPAVKRAKGRRAQKARTISYSARAAGTTKGVTTVTMHIKPGSAAARALRLHKKLRVTVSVLFTPTGGSKRTVTSSVTAKAR
jgi:hypothetical protein